GEQHVVMPAQGIKGSSKRDEIAGYESRSLMDQLIERMLAISPRLTPINRPGVAIHRKAVDCHVLAVALHGELLEIGRKALEVLLIRQYSDRLSAEEVVVPDAEQTHQYRQGALEWRRAEIVVHLMEAAEHGAEIVRTESHHGREADGRIHRIAAADPIPEAKHIGCIDAKLRYLLGTGGDGDKMFRDSGFVLQARQHPLARGARVRQRFERGEGLGRDNKQCLGWIEIAHRFCEIGAIDIGHEAESHGALTIVLERFA